MSSSSMFGRRFLLRPTLTDIVYPNCTNRNCPVGPHSDVQGGWGGWPTGNGKKLSSCQAQLGQATCLAVAKFISISCGSSTPSALYTSPPPRGRSTATMASWHSEELKDFGRTLGRRITVRLRNIGNSSGEFCVGKLIASNYAGQISAIHT